MDSTSTQKVETFFSQFPSALYKKGEVLIRGGEEPKGIFYLTKGQIKQYSISKKGEELVVNVFKPFAFFPMSWAMNNTPNDYFFEAMTDVEIRVASSDGVVKFIKDNPDVLYDLLQRVYKGTDGMLIKMSYLMSGSAYTRLITELVIYAKRFGSGKNSIELDLSEIELAAQSGMTRETVSREMKKLKEKGLITMKNNTFHITSIQMLEDELVSIK